MSRYAARPHVPKRVHFDLPEDHQEQPRSILRRPTRGLPYIDFNVHDDQPYDHNNSNASQPRPSRHASMPAPGAAPRARRSRLRGLEALHALRTYVKEACNLHGEESRRALSVPSVDTLIDLVDFACNLRGDARTALRSEKGVLRRLIDASKRHPHEQLTPPEPHDSRHARATMRAQRRRARREADFHLLQFVARELRLPADALRDLPTKQRAARERDAFEHRIVKFYGPRVTRDPLARHAYPAGLGGFRGGGGPRPAHLGAAGGNSSAPNSPAQRALSGPRSPATDPAMWEVLHGNVDFDPSMTNFVLPQMVSDAGHTPHRSRYPPDRHPAAALAAAAANRATTAQPLASAPFVAHGAAHVSPHQQTLTSPYQQPLTSPYQQPLTSPYQQTLTSPYQQTLTSPYQQPLTSPYQQPLTSPYQQPLTSPYQQPLATPYAQMAMAHGGAAAAPAVVTSNPAHISPHQQTLTSPFQQPLPPSFQHQLTSPYGGMSLGNGMGNSAAHATTQHGFAPSTGQYLATSQPVAHQPAQHQIAPGMSGGMAMATGAAMGTGMTLPPTPADQISNYASHPQPFHPQPQLQPQPRLQPQPLAQQVQQPLAQQGQPLAGGILPASRGAGLLYKGQAPPPPPPLTAAPTTAGQAARSGVGRGVGMGGGAGVGYTGGQMVGQDTGRMAAQPDIKSTNMTNAPTNANVNLNAGFQGGTQGF